MNVLQGLEIEGLQLLTEDNFNSVPGLWQWNDGRERIQLGTGVKVWEDKSSQGNNLVQPNPVKQPSYQNGLWVVSTDNTILLKSPRRNYRFLHNGSRFGVYTIMKNEWSLTTPAQATGAFRTTGNSGTGLQYTFGSNASSGRFTAIIRGGATVPTKTLTNLLNPANANYSPSGEIYASTLVNFGQTSNVRLRYGNAVTNTTPFFATTAEYPIGNNSEFIVCQSFTGITLRMGLLLIYNWTGYTLEQVQEFHTRVMNLLNIERQNFENADI